MSLAVKVWNGIVSLDEITEAVDARGLENSLRRYGAASRSRSFDSVNSFASRVNITLRCWCQKDKS